MSERLSRLAAVVSARRALAALVLAVVVLAVVAGGAHHGASEANSLTPASANRDGGNGVGERPAGRAAPKPKQCLEPADLRSARHFVATRDGSIGFAFLDERGRLVGDDRNRVFPSASVIKVMLLTAYLRRHEVSHRDLNGSERDLLGAMITASDNHAADDVFAIVGEAGLNEVAAAADMANFESSPFWGGSGITAADQASFVGRLERYVPSRHEDYALKLLASIIPDHTWGVADVKPRHWELHFKGGWYLADDGWRVNQVATLRRGSRSFALAVLSDQDSSFQYGRDTIRGIAKRLMAAYPR